MRSIHSRQSIKYFAVKLLALSFLITLLTACGSNSAANPGSAQSTTVRVTKTVTTVPASNPLSPNTTNLRLQEGNLLIQSEDGFQCPYHTFLGTVTNQLILASDRTTYSQAEVDEMHAYYRASNTFVFPDGATPTPPPTLRWVLGGAATIPGETLGGNSYCGVSLELTNTGNTPIQIPKVGVQLRASPRKNTYHYRLIDACSFLPPSEQGAIGLCPPTSGGGGNCNFYSASIQLGLGDQNTAFSAIPQGYSGNCGILTLAPTTQDTLNIDFSLSPNTTENLIYSLVPTFTVTTTQGTQPLILSQLASTLTFASNNQFSCYTLQGTTFILETTPKGWCI